MRSGLSSTPNGSRRSRSASTHCIRPRANSACSRKRCPRNTPPAARNWPRSTPPPIWTACTPPKPKRRKPIWPRPNNSRRRAPKPPRRCGSAVTTGMQELSMKGGSFEVALVALPEGGAHGLEQIEFRVAGHAGVPLRPLAKVASGGELARISLALAVIASAASPTPTLIFDEVDTGIGGGVAEVVGACCINSGAPARCCASRICRKSPRAATIISRWRRPSDGQRWHGQQRHVARQGEPHRGSRAHARRAGNHRHHAQAREGNAGGVDWPAVDWQHQAAIAAAAAAAQHLTQTPASTTPAPPARSASTAAGSTRAFSIPSSRSLCCSLR